MKKSAMEFIITGPCSLESKEQMIPVVEMAKECGLTYLRAPLFKPRTHPKSFQGLGEEALPIIEWLESEGFKLVSEALSESQVDMVGNFASVIQIGARNMQNFELLKYIGRVYQEMQKHPYIMLKRGFSNTFSEWLAASEYLAEYGVPREKIILCERGTRNNASPQGICLDFSMALKAKREAPYKVIVDPSHGSKTRQDIVPLMKATETLGLDGVMVEVHPTPHNSVSDPDQAITPGEFKTFFYED